MSDESKPEKAQKPPVNFIHEMLKQMRDEQRRHHDELTARIEAVRGELGARIEGVRAELGTFRSEVNDRFRQLNNRLDDVIENQERHEARLDAHEARFDVIEADVAELKRGAK